MHSRQIDSSSYELGIGYIMPSIDGEHVELKTKRSKLNADLKLRKAEVKYIEPNAQEECRRKAEYYLSEDVTKMVLDHIHQNAKFGTFSRVLCGWWQRFISKHFNRKIRIKLSTPKKATNFFHSLISLHRNALLKEGVNYYTEFILCGPHQMMAFEAVMGFRFSNAFSKHSTPFGQLHYLGDIRGVNVFVDPKFKSDYIVIGHRPNSDLEGTVVVHTERRTVTTMDSVSAKMMVGFVDFERQTEYHAVAIQAQSVYF